MTTVETMNTAKMMAHTMAAQLEVEPSAILELAACLMDEINYHGTAALLRSGHAGEIISTTTDSLEACLADAQQLRQEKEEQDSAFYSEDDYLAWSDRLEDDEKALNVLKEISGL